MPIDPSPSLAWLLVLVLVLMGGGVTRQTLRRPEPDHLMQGVAYIPVILIPSTAAVAASHQC